MKNKNIVLVLRTGVAVAALMAVAACTNSAPPPKVAAAPPPPVKVSVPARPLPPGGASRSLELPAKSSDGTRLTVNANISPLEAVWNFRSGWNVAALNCLEAKYEPILDGYKLYLAQHKDRLKAVNRELDRKYEEKLGDMATREREAYMTQVYNYYALPPAHDYFCDAALEVSQAFMQSQPDDLDAFSQSALVRLERAFTQFYDDMERYWVDVAEWDAKYGGLYGGRGVGRSIYTSAPVNVTYDNGARVPLSAQTSQMRSSSGRSSQPAQPASQPMVQPLPEDDRR